MFDGLFIASLISVCAEGIKRGFEPTITAEQRANEKLLNDDIIKGVPYEKIKKNILNGKYRLPKPQVEEKHPEPHINPQTGKIIIENYTLYNQDIMKYNGGQVMKWAKQGKYNLTSEELEIERRKYKEKYNNC